MQTELNALGCHIYAGGSTIGVKNHFNVLGHMEETPYGVKSVKLNYPELPIAVGKDKWKPFVDDLIKESGKVDYLYTNPPCAIFSVAGATMRGGRDAWRTDPRQSCWRNCIEMFEYVQPDVFSLESVVRSYQVGQEFIGEFVQKAHDLGYSVTHVLIDAQYLGLPQRRKRYFMVFHKKSITWQSPNWAPPQTVFEALETVDDPGPVLEVKDANQRRLIPKLKPGEALRPLWEKEVPEETWERTTFGVKGRPRMFVHRVDGNKVMGTITGDYFIHPTEDRFMGMNELRKLNGYPLDYQLEGRSNYHASFLARGVCPPVASWLAGNVKNALLYGSPESGKTHVVDFREPPKM